jgi:hypothetical protein
MRERNNIGFFHSEGNSTLFFSSEQSPGFHGVPFDKCTFVKEDGLGRNRGRRRRERKLVYIV